jgi:hypothetical protein
MKMFKLGDRVRVSDLLPKNYVVSPDLLGKEGVVEECVLELCRVKFSEPFKLVFHPRVRRKGFIPLGWSTSSAYILSSDELDLVSNESRIS